MANKKNKNNLFNEVNQDPNLKRTVFFGFYTVFFLVLVILLRTGYKNNNLEKKDNKKTGYNYDYKLDLILNQNYHFVYKENSNGVETIYEGDLLDNVSSFVKSGTVSLQYYQQNDDVYVKDNNLLTWAKVENPIIFNKFTNAEKLNTIIRKSKYISMTDYIDSEMKEFNYEISNNSLRNIFDIEEIEEDKLINKITVTIMENGKIKSIMLDLSNYYGYNNTNISNYVITLSYSKFDKIEEITNPLN